MKFVLPLALVAATASANNGGHKHTAAAETMRKAFLTNFSPYSNGTRTMSVFKDGMDLDVLFTCVSRGSFPALAASLNQTVLLEAVLPSTSQAVALIHVQLRDRSQWAALGEIGLMPAVVGDALPTQILVSTNLGKGGFIGEGYGTSIFKLDGSRYISFPSFSAWTHVVPSTNTCYFGARIEYTRRKRNYAAADAEQVEEEGDDDYSDELEALSDEN